MSLPLLNEVVETLDQWLLQFDIAGGQFQKGGGRVEGRGDSGPVKVRDAEPGRGTPIPKDPAAEVVDLPDKDLGTLREESAALDAHLAASPPTPKQMSAMRVYASDQGYSEMNGKLRSRPDAKHSASSSIAQLSTAISEQPDFKTPIEVYRGMSFRNPTDRDAFLSNVDRGEFRSNGFLSTTIDPGVAKDYAKPMEHGSAVIKIKAKKGLWTGRNVSAGGEREMILNHKSRFKVTTRKKLASGAHYIEMEQVE